MFSDGIELLDSGRTRFDQFSRDTSHVFPLALYLFSYNLTPLNSRLRDTATVASQRHKRIPGKKRNMSVLDTTGQYFSLKYILILYWYFTHLGLHISNKIPGNC